MTSDDDENDVQTVINNLALSKSRFTPAYLYALNICRQNAIEDPSAVTTAEYWERHKAARLEYDTLDDDTKELWICTSRAHILKQPHIADQIVTMLQQNPKRSWLGLEEDLGNWCSAVTIRKWLTSRESFKHYAERIFPNLLPHQKLKHKEFAYRFRKNWGLGKGKNPNLMRSGCGD